MMRTSTTFTRNNVTLAAIALAVMALPLIGYAVFASSEPAAAATAPVTQTASSAPTVMAADTIDTVAIAEPLDGCRAEAWPYLSKDCLHGARTATQPRRIAITAEAAAASAAMDDHVKLAAAVSPHASPAIKKHKHASRHQVAARRVRAREAFAEVTPSQLRASSLPASW